MKDFAVCDEGLVFRDFEDIFLTKGLLEQINGCYENELKDLIIETVKDKQPCLDAAVESGCIS